MPNTVHPEVLTQLEGLALEDATPLVISDADEVLIQFMAALEDYLEENGMYFDWSSFALSGNIRRRSDDGAVERDEIKALLETFFTNRVEELRPVPGAAQALAALARRAQIVVLTNIPMAQREMRQRNLARHGMDYPVIANVGGKGAAVRHLAERVAAPVFFLDDIPSHHAAVAAVADRVYRVHLIADPRLGTLLGKAEDSHFRADDWVEARAFIEERLDELGY